MNKKESQQHPHSSFNRGIYLVRYTGNGQEDKPNNPGLLVIPNGACKFGQSLNLDTVEKRYISHFKKEENVIEMHILARIQNRDDIDNIEKKLHKHFHDRRLLNKNNRPSEWMESIDSKELKKAFKKIFLEHFHVSV